MTSRNPNISNAGLNFNEYGLLEVSFICKGNIEYPTALREGCDIYGEPAEVFRLGAETARLLPQYSYNRYNVQERAFTCVSLCLQDGSPYWPAEAARTLADSDKFRVFRSDAQSGDFGLLRVSFDGVGLIGNKPIWPTSLASGKSVEEKALDAFWGGSETVKLPADFRRNDERVGWVWHTESVCKADGSAVTDGGLICEYLDMRNFDVCGKMDITQYGFETYPGAERKVSCTVRVYLDKGSPKFSAVPYYITRYVRANVCAVLEDSRGEEELVCESQGARGYLAGSAYAASAGEPFMKKTISTGGLNSSVSSAPSYSEYMAAFAEGYLLDSEARLAFVDAAGDRWFYRIETFLNPNGAIPSEE